jgi:hypothetical protein
MKQSRSTLLIATLLMCAVTNAAENSAEQAVRDKYEAKFGELKKRTEITQAEFQQRADDISKEANTPFKLDMTVKWNKRDLSLNLPQTTVRTRHMSLDLPTTKWGMMHIGPLHTKGPVFKMERRNFSLDIPEFKYTRSNMVMTIPEFTVREANFLVPINSSELKEKGAKLEADARAAFAKLTAEYWDLNTAQQGELAVAVSGTPDDSSANTSPSDRVLKSYDAAIAQIDATLGTNEKGQDRLLSPDEKKRLLADKADLVAARTKALEELKTAFADAPQK